VYEQDWLVTTYMDMQATRNNVSLLPRRLCFRFVFASRLCLLAPWHVLLKAPPARFRLRAGPCSSVVACPDLDCLLCCAQVTNAANWLYYMGNAAAAADLTIQYCMPLPFHILQRCEAIPSNALRCIPIRLPVVPAG
jgi:hypothetical protein